MASKIVILGDINGKLSEVFGKLTTLHSKQNFAFALIAGNLFADPDTATDDDNQELVKLLQGSISVPLPTYFALGRRALPAAVTEKLESSLGELCPNLTVLGRKVSIKTSEGFRLVAVGGQHVDITDEPMSQYTATYKDTDAAAATKGLVDADILLTSDWPANVRDGANAQYVGDAPAGVQSISDLCTALKPRYHFSISDTFYEREPFFHDGPSPRSVTRFLSLAPYGNASKQKWIYAFSLEPSAPPPSLGAGITASPFTATRKRKLVSQEDNYNNFRYANGSGDAPYERGGGRGKRQRYQPPPKPDECFFCLSNKNCETHMIASIGSDVYLTIAKGSLPLRSTFPSLNFPGHILLIPLQHSPTMSAIADKEARQSTVTEMQRYRGALQSMLVAKSKGEDGRSQLGAVTWEISRSSGVHLHWQFMPVPVDLIQRGLVEAAFDVEAENSTYPKFVKSYKDMEEAEEGDFLKVMIWSESLRKEMVLPLDKSFRFDLQFGRRVLGKLLGLEKRAHWKDCAQSQAEEEADAAAFKEAFKAFDFSLEEA
ncbi:hypothetical protein LTR36_000783 [Oleoguttula mirabilis]|uniref:Uncharacterized protein n=1 Tax=Oleoguttula mirabilis TaxID=1507867 RepID=A0AAV9J3Z9_9PEZI|nr:hypothetical protein LTR36_000783 [Oleoguttula mirabilis]